MFEQEAGVFSFDDQGSLSLLSGAGDGQRETIDVALDITLIEIKDCIGVGCSGQQIFRLLT